MKNLYDTLEFNKIQEKLNLYIKTEVGKNLVNTLELSTDFFLLQKELSFVEEMMNLIVRFGTLPIINSSDLAIKIGFAKKGGILTPKDLNEVSKYQKYLTELKDMIDIDNLERFSKQLTLMNRDALLKIRRLSIFRVFQRTLVMLMPIAIIGAYFQLMRNAVFSPDSFIYNVLNFDKTMPDDIWYAGAFISSGMVRATFGLFGLYAAYFSARYTARLYKKDSTSVGMTAVIVIMFCAYANNLGDTTGNRSPFSASILKVNAMLLALLIGYVVGQIFHWLGKDHEPIEFEHTSRIRKRAWDALLPASVSILGGLILGVSIYELQIRIMSSDTFKTLVAQVENR